MITPDLLKLTNEPTSREEEHRIIHVELHKKLDELVADFISHNENVLPSQTSILELIQWSHQQTMKPT